MSHPRPVRLAVVAGLAFLLFGSAGVARAQNDFFRSSPGPLSRSHEKQDGQDNCNQCHDGSRETNDDKCLGCHDHNNLRDEIRRGEGFHASTKVKGKRCESCHLEHRGRSFDLMGWRAVGGQNKFDHKLTGWKLQGKHAAIDCKDCHKDTNHQGLRTFIGEDKVCGSCHKRDQPHGFDKSAFMKCERCHGQSVWKPPLKKLDFDHNDPKDAAMPLEGTHKSVTCAKCHPKSKFNLGRPKPADCEHCHKSPHGGHLFGTKKCDWCHSPKLRSLRKFRFDHAKRTKFDLAGAHSKLSCYKCHTQRMGKRKPDRNCEVCHAADDKHRGRFKEFGTPHPHCNKCHPSSSWKPTVFNHNKNTRFKLTGKHAKITCRKCHRGKKPDKFERFNAKTVGCMGCHQHKNVHDREFKDKDCLRCHKDPGVLALTKRSVNIYHGPKSRFPLIRKHKRVPCEKCHINDVYQNTPMECGVRCHEDSLHRGSLGDDCSRCHAGGTWKAIRFDHTEDTKWPLVGLHKKVPTCEECHPQRQYAGTPKNCSAQGCHAKDDAHKGKLGTTCEKCHLETGENLFDHNTMARFKLDGQHLQTKCSECHPSITFKPRPTNCFGCHPDPDIHKGQFGTACENCHNTTSFADIKPLHDVGDFSLKGAHDRIPCVRCHKDNRPLAGSGNLCINCHRQDDIHSNSLSPRCGECHTQWSFTPARFDHTTVGCSLTGLHRVIACRDCHKSGNFGGLSPQCVSCHRDDALSSQALAGFAGHTGVTTCANCHNPNTWLGAATANSPASYGRESICR